MSRSSPTIDSLTSVDERQAIRSVVRLDWSAKEFVQSIYDRVALDLAVKFVTHLGRTISKSCPEILA